MMCHCEYTRHIGNVRRSFALMYMYTTCACTCITSLALCELKLDLIIINTKVIILCNVRCTWITYKKGRHKSKVADVKIFCAIELYTERNINMTEKIEKFLKKQGTYFVVVGAAHLIGKKGIIELLKK